MAHLEAVIDTSGVAGPLELVMPAGGRPRQLPIRTLLVGILLCLADGRPAHLVRVHAALVALSESDQRRLGIIEDWRRGPHQLTYRQVERTFSTLTAVLAAGAEDGHPSDSLAIVCDQLLEASIPAEHKQASTSLAVDWTDIESHATPPPRGEARADTEASWGHRNAGMVKGELFYGFYLQIATMVADTGGQPVPELVRRMLLASCKVDPPPAFVAVLERMRALAIVIGDVIVDSGYAHRLAARFALPLRRLGARLVMDLHPSDRGPHGTWAGAIVANGNLWCPATPTVLLQITPLARGATADELAAHDARCAEALHYKLGRQSADDADGHHRVGCPAAAGKLRCPLRPDSMGLPYNRPEILDPPQQPPTCCAQQTITVPPAVNAKTAQRHDYPSPEWRRSYNRRTAVERSNARIKDPATIDTTKGWCRLFGMAGLTLFLASALIVRNIAIADTFQTRQTLQASQPPEPRARRRRRQTIGDLIDSS